MTLLSILTTKLDPKRYLPPDSKAIDDDKHFFSGESVFSFHIIELFAFIGDTVAFLEKGTPKDKVKCIHQYFERLRDVYQTKDKAPRHGCL